MFDDVLTMILLLWFFTIPTVMKVIAVMKNTFIPSFFRYNFNVEFITLGMFLFQSLVSFDETGDVSNPVTVVNDIMGFLLFTVVIAREVYVCRQLHSKKIDALRLNISIMLQEKFGLEYGYKYYGDEVSREEWHMYVDESKFWHREYSIDSKTVDAEFKNVVNNLKETAIAEHNDVLLSKIQKLS